MPTSLSRRAIAWSIWAKRDRILLKAKLSIGSKCHLMKKLKVREPMKLRIHQRPLDPFNYLAKLKLQP